MSIEQTQPWTRQLQSLAALPSVRMAVLGILCGGVATAATFPYLPILAIDELGLSPTLFSTVIFVEGLLAVGVALTVGYFSDRMSSRKPLLVIGTIAGVVGYVLLPIFPAPATVVATMLIFLPLSATVIGQNYALLRVQLLALPAPDRAVPNAIARSCIALAWIAVPPITAVLLWSGLPLTTVFLGAAAVCALYLAVLAPARFDAAAPADGSPRPRHGFPLALLLGPSLLGRLFAVGLLDAVLKLHGLFFGLMLLNDLGGTLAHVGIAQGVMAAFEIPFMLFWAAVARRTGLQTVLMAAAAVEVIYMALLSQVGSVSVVFMLLAIHSLGASAIMSISISYVQDLLAEHPGLGSSLISVTGLIGTTVAAGAFAVAAALWSYSGAALLAAGLAMLGGWAIWLCRKDKPPPTPEGPETAAP